MKKKISNNSFGSPSKIKNIITTRSILFGAAFVVFGLAAIFWHQTSFAQGNQQNTEKTNEKQAENVWQTVEKSEIANRAEGLPDNFQTLRLDKQRLASLLSDAPHESNVPLKDSELILQFPMPDGTFSRFRVQEAPILEESLQARFPEIKSYRALAVDDAGTTARFDLTPQGFHATILTPDKTFSILPADTGDNTLYASYDGAQQLDGDFFCQVEHHNHADESSRHITDAVLAPQASVGSTLRTYRVAISTTYEYSTDVGGGTMAGTVASINTWMNGVNAIYERDLAIRLIVIDAPSLIFLNASDPYTDDPGVGGNPPVNNIGLLIKQFRNRLRDNVVENTYNLGHLFARHQPGGAAGVGVVCHPSSDADGPFKGAGVTGLIPPAGHLGALNVLAHEFGHMFNAPHNFNSKYFTCAGNDGTNRVPTGAFEPGAGNTIMSYPNRCGGPGGDFNLGDNIIGGEYMRFHASNFAQINNHVINGTAAAGTACFTAVNTGNTPPTVSAGANYTIPRLTPFTLTATGSDPDLGDQYNLTYTWEQYQAGGTNFFQDGTAASFNDALDPVNTTRPIFRALPATTNASRTFPSLAYILNNANDPPDKVLEFGRSVWTAEELPRISRTLDFRVTARDTVGGISDSSNVVTVDGTAGPFTVNDTTGPWTGGTSQTVAWNVANTGAATNVNTANVRISLSTDGGQSFPITLTPSTPNDGSHSVSVPNGITTTAARIKVEAIGNVFFDITGPNFSIAPGGTCPVINDFTPKVAAVGSTVEITGIGFTGANAVAFNGVNAPTFTVNSDTKITVTVPIGATGGAITVSEPNCGAAESANFTVCSGTTTEVKKDDGMLNFSGGAFQGRGYYVNRLTPSSYPATLSEVKIFHKNGGFPVGKAITIVSAANPSGNTNINNVSLNTREATIETLGTPVPPSTTPPGAYNTYPVDPITITSGDFIVGYSFVSETVNFQALAVDDTDFADLSYTSTDGETFTPQNFFRDIYMIRAVAYSGACSTGNCSPVISISDNTIEGFRGGTAGLTGFFVNRLTPSSYPATLTEVRIYFQASQGYDVGKAINVLSAANPSSGTNIDNANFNTRAATITARDTYISYPIDPITIASGDFLVGYSIVHQTNPMGQGLASIAHDATPPIQGRSYTKDNGGTNFSVEPDVNHPIRAVLFSNACSGCTYSVTPTSQTFLPAGGTGTATVTTQAGCPWTASRNNYWIGLTSNFRETVLDTPDNRLSAYLGIGSPNFQDLITGTGNGSATFTVAANNGNARTGTITVAGQTFTVAQTLAPTAASVTIGGRVLTSTGIGVRGAIISLVDQAGQTRTSRTSSFGYYRFDEIEVGNTMILNVTSKRYTFAPQLITISDSIDNLDFVSLE